MGVNRDPQARFGLENNRTILEWGQAIFSDLCIIVRPQNADVLYSMALHGFRAWGWGLGPNRRKGTSYI